MLIGTVNQFFSQRVLLLNEWEEYTKTDIF